MSILIYHNTRCSKSRGALQILQEKGVPYEVRLYLQELLTKAELKALLTKLHMQPSALLRKGEELYKELNKEPHTEAEWLDLLVQHPQLIERPIVVAGNKAVVARPPERVLEILE